MAKPTALELGQLIGLIHRTAAAAQSRLLTVPGVTISTAPILTYIAAHPDCTAQEAADGLAINKGLVSRGLSQLVAAKLVTKRRVAGRVALRLTQAGASAQQAADAELTAWWQEQLAASNMKHRKQFARNLAALAAQLAPEHQIGQ